MNKRVKILTEGFVTPNGRAFLFPLIVFRREIAARGIRLSFHTSHTDDLDCDTLIVDSKYFRDWWVRDEEAVISFFVKAREHANRILYFDTTDSSGWVQTELLPYIDAYCKSQLVRDRSAYLKPMYGHRPFADYYHRVEGVVDEHPEFSKAVGSLEDTRKLCLSWNSGLADYSVYGLVRMGLYQRFRWPKPRFPRRFTRPSGERPLDIACRMGINYPRDSVAHQRRKIRSLLADQLPTDKLSRRKFFAEMEHAKVIVSPFGFGEITLKDFEVFLTGGLLLKPDMSHMETWPAFFEGGRTMVTHKWDCSDVREVIQQVLGDYDSFLDIAVAGQDRYRQYLSDADLFVSHFSTLLEEA